MTRASDFLELIEGRLFIGFTTDQEMKKAKEICSKYNESIQYSVFSDEVLVDGDTSVLLKIENEVNKSVNKLKGMSVSWE